MRPELLALLTPNERADYDALTFPRCGKGCDDYSGGGGFPQNGRCGRPAGHTGVCDPDDARYTPPADHIAALTALAEARARVAELERRIRHAAALPCDDHDHDARWCPTCNTLGRVRVALNATPGEDPAPRGAGAPGASFGGRAPGRRCGCGGRLVLNRHENPNGVTLDCDTCEASYSEDGSHWCPGCQSWPKRWVGGTDSDPRPWCEKCGAEQPGWGPGEGTPDASGGASGVGVLTNCDSCVFARPERRGVLSCGSLLARMEKPGQAEWSSHHRAASGHPKPGATGCPGWAKREGA